MTSIDLVPPASRSPSGRRRRGLLICAALIAAAVAAGWAIRVWGVEPPEPAWACQSPAPPWWCPLRTGAIAVLRANAVGFVALLAGLAAIWTGSGRAALTALVFGGAGLVLYGAEPASGGLLLGALALLRR